ncbi:hypothetical protein N9917_00155 [Deltaproteobacteria bacterium]|nr:hypothetical protein [Deltaproteobacteria bacterium]
MPDISMCMNQTCPKRSQCYRYRVAPNPYRQSYGSFASDTEENPCRYFAAFVEADQVLPTEEVDARLARIRETSNANAG